MPYVYALLMLVGVFVSFFHMLRVRREGARGVAVSGKFTSEDWAFAMLGMFLGGLIIPGLIYYWGWKNRFSTKIRAIRVISVGCLVVYILLLGGYAYYQYAIAPQAQPDATAQASNQSSQETTQTQEGSLASDAVTTVTGANYSITIPNQWIEDSNYEQAGSGYFTKVWSAADLSQSIALGWTNQTDPSVTELRVENTVLGKVSSGAYTLTHPVIAGAVKTNLAVSRSEPGSRWDGYLFVHASGTNVYEIQGTLLNSTPSDISAMTQLLLSFQLTQ